MTPAAARAVKLSSLAIAVTGVLLGLALYTYEPADDFASLNHPLAPKLQHAHVLVAPVFVFYLGWIFPSHVWPRVVGGYRDLRTSGLGLFGSLLPMIASGYLLQVSTSNQARTLWIAVHLVSSVAWTLLFAAHVIGAHRPGVKPPGSPRPSSSKTSPKDPPSK